VKGDEMAVDLNTQSLAFIEQLYRQYEQDPGAVPPEWRDYFAELEQRDGSRQGDSPRLIIGRQQLLQPTGPGGERCHRCGRTFAITTLQHRVNELIRNYRVRGHRIARVNPLQTPQAHLPELEPAYYGFTGAELDLEFAAGTLAAAPTLPLREIFERLRATYCGSIGVQFMHIDEMAERQWLQERMENSLNRISLSREQQVRVLTRLIDAVTFEQFVQTKFVGAKSFSLEGAESLVPLLDMAINQAGAQGVKEIVLAMPHRGRLNVLANIMRKHPRRIFSEFRDRDAEKYIGRGDVKYHLGYFREVETAVGAMVDIYLTFNPSHLEYANPVALGFARGNQDRRGDAAHERGLVILIHGDASLAGQGIVQESLNLSQLDGYAVGGTLHVVVNNQIGFTTLPAQARSGPYATDVARMLQVPIFHVNGENPEAVAQAVHLALEYRKRFRHDVVIDMYCYRRRGHNEGDEPRFTQPGMYRAIERRRSVQEGYQQHLIELGELTQEETDRIVADRREFLQEEYERVDSSTDRSDETQSPLAAVWASCCGGPDGSVPEPDTGVERARLAQLLGRLAELPDRFHPHPKIQRLLDARRQMSRGERPLDWGAAEALCFATLATEGVPVRLTGQDSERGTFSHRHAVLHDFDTDRTYAPLQHLAEGQAPVQIINSPLSEGAVLGFEYGYGLAYPEGLTIWEAQFGDFVNVAQVYVDQFIASAESKWQILSGLVLLLPHGLEGTGPEHASARLERFLALGAADNYQVVYPTTPAQLFHCLRRQVLRAWRKPLVVMSPKSMLRHPLAVSTLQELSEGRFRRVLPDPRPTPGRSSRVLLCSGKVYYDLYAERERLDRGDVAIIRLEQLYPLRYSELEPVLQHHPDGAPVVWVQEEPENMGAFAYVTLKFAQAIRRRWPLHYVSRPESASPATGSAASHKLEQQTLLDQAFGALG
jgi:2-oxoglutarate dehydrogenase E1 component